MAKPVRMIERLPEKFDKEGLEVEKIWLEG